MSRSAGNFISPKFAGLHKLLGWTQKSVHVNPDLMTCCSGRCVFSNYLLVKVLLVRYLIHKARSECNVSFRATSKPVTEHAL